MSVLLSTLEALAIVTALSMDAFVSSFAYGTNKIKIPILSVFVINAVCTSILVIALLFGSVVGQFLPPQVTLAIGFLTLLFLGLTKLFDSAVKAMIRKRKAFRKKIEFSAFNLGFILNIYADPEAADRDDSRELSPTEAAYLAVALSLDGAAVGFGAGITNTSLLLVLGFSLLVHMLAIPLGCWLGNKVAEKFSLDLAWLSGAMLVVLAFLKLF